MLALKGLSNVIAQGALKASPDISEPVIGVLNQIQGTLQIQR